MPGITNPAEEYFKDGLWGWVSTAWEKLVSSGGRLFTALHGWDGSAWRKLPMVFGYSDRYYQRVVDADASAGTDTVSGTAVPDGEVWVITNISATNSITDPSSLHLGVLAGGLLQRLKSFYAPGVNITVSVQGWWVMKEGDYVQAEFRGCTAGDDLYLYIYGFKMKIAE